MTELVGVDNNPWNAVEPSFNQRIVYFFSGCMVTALPIYVYSQIYGLNLQEYAPLFGAITVLSSLILSLAYHNFSLRFLKGVQADREGLITKDMAKRFGNVGDGQDRRKAINKAWDELKQEQYNNTASEVTGFSVVLVNAMFLALFLFLQVILRWAPAM